MAPPPEPAANGENDNKGLHAAQREPGSGKEVCLSCRVSRTSGGVYIDGCAEEDDFQAADRRTCVIIYSWI